MLPQFLSPVVGWETAHHFYSLGFEQRGVALWAFMRTWEKTPSVGLLWPLQTVLPLMPNTSCQCSGQLWPLWVVRHPLLLFCRGSYVLADTYSEYLGSRYSHKWVEYTVSDLRLLKRCLHKASSSVFGPLDPFSMTEFIVTRLKGTEHCDWIMSRSSFRHAIITGELSMPSLVEVLSNVVGVWPLIVVYLKETGRKTDDDSLVV